ncbi:MAG: photolyase, partial [Bacteroidota bacterium]
MWNSIYFWFRRDLRLNDNHGLFEALQFAKANALTVQC